jgi:hypothetical protein
VIKFMGGGNAGEGELVSVTNLRRSAGVVFEAFREGRGLLLHE